MPVLVNPKVCVDREHCFAADACPYGAFIHNTLKKTWEVDATICGDCPGPCLNFCDKDALRWGDDLVDLSFVKAEIEGRMKPDEVTVARMKHKQDLKAAEEEAKKKASTLVALTRANFEQEVVRSELPVVVDCWADWCSPCKQFSPVFEATAKQYEGSVKFAKLNTDEQPALAQGLGIQALPTVLMFYKGQLVNGAEGALPASQFQGWIYQTLLAIRQYEQQLQAESADAIGAASQNLSSLEADGAAAGAGPEAQAPAAGPGLVTGSRAAGAQEPKQPPKQQPPEEPRPGKRTASGLYIP